MDTKVHFIAPYFMNPLHPITIDLVGAGGSGSQMLSVLARINNALVALDRKGLYVRVWDPDIVEDTNVGRQLFSPADIGVNKAVALVSRFNRFYGTDWDASPKKFESEYRHANIVISCVDNIASRKTIASIVNKGMRAKNADEYHTWYWLDLGNAKTTGQAILGSAKIVQPEVKGCVGISELPTFDKEFSVDDINEEDSGPSCSMAEALSKQDLFINSTIAQLSGSLLWNLLTKNATENRGFYLNLDTLTSVPIAL